MDPIDNANQERRKKGHLVQPLALVVDDERDALAAAIELFESIGYTVRSAACGGEALQILRRIPEIEVLYTDVLMPRMDGVTLARKARDCNPGLKILLVSASPDVVADLHGGDPSEFKLLMKPVLPSEITIALSR
jgi:CheY-like chemotaxis protein